MIVIFDVVGTLFSLSRVREALREASVPEEFLPFWFARLLHVNMASALASRYVAFADAAESSLRQALAFRRLPLDVVPAALHLTKRINRGFATGRKPRAYTLYQRLEFSQVAQTDTHYRMACQPHSRGQQWQRSAEPWFSSWSFAGASGE